MRICLGVLVLALAAGCAAPPPEGTEGVFSTAALGTHLNRLTAPLAPDDTLAQARRVRYAAERLRAADVQPHRVGSFLLPHPKALGQPEALVGGRAHVVGLLAGRDPNVSSELILVAVDLDRPEAAALLEVVHRLGQEGRFAVVPRRTVGVVLLGPPRTGAPGVADVVTRPLWASHGKMLVLLPALDTTAVAPRRAAWEAAGLPVDVVALPPEPGRAEAGRAEALRLGATYRLAERLYARLRADDPFPSDVPADAARLVP